MVKPKHEHLKRSTKNLPDFKKEAGELSDHAKGDVEAYEKALDPVIKDMIGIVQIATLGEVERVKELIKHPGNFLENVMKEDQGRLLGYLQVRGFYEVATRPSNKDPLEWAKLQLDIAKHQDRKKLAGRGGGNGRDDDGPGRTSEEVAVFSNELLRAVDPAGEDSGSGGS